MSPRVIFQLIVGAPERALLVDLLEERVTNLEGHRAAIAEIPELAAVADEGYESLDEQLATARGVLALLREDG